MYRCCGHSFENVENVYTHILNKHCDGIITTSSIPQEPTRYEKEMDQLNEQGLSQSIVEEGFLFGFDCGLDYDHTMKDDETCDTLRNHPFNVDDFFEKLKLSNDRKIFNVQESNFDAFELGLFDFSKRVFKTQEEIFAFILVNYHGLSAEGYDFFKYTLRTFFNSDSSVSKFPHYDTILARKKELVGDLIEGNSKSNFVRISIETRIRNMCSDPHLFKRMCLDREKLDQEQQKTQPYHTNIFKECLGKCPPNAFPFTLLHYIDDFAKHRTKDSSTCASYFTTYNWDRDFLNSLDSIQVHGFSSNHVGFWEMTDEMIKQLEKLEGEVIEVLDPNGKPFNLFICSIGFIWDTVERLKCLSLMKSECSRCEEMDGVNISKTPDFLLGSEILDAENSITCKKRKVDEMQNIHDTYLEKTLPLSQKDKRRVHCKGLKEIILEEEELKDERLSKTKRNQKMRETPLWNRIDNPFIGQKFINPFSRALVDFFHVEIQGLFRTHLKLLIKKLGYGTAMDDLILACKSTLKPNGKPLVMKPDITTISGIEMLDFIVCSVPIIHELIFYNPKITTTKLPKEERTELFDSWILHMQYFCKISKENLILDDIILSEKMVVAFRSKFRTVFGEASCIFPNFHWITHLFEDCKLFGEVTWFWALLFELKHGQFKKFNDRSNNKCLEFRGLELDVSLNELYRSVPWTRSLTNMDQDYVHTSATLKPNMFVCFTHYSKRYIGKITAIQSNGLLTINDTYIIGDLDTLSMLYSLNKIDVPIKFFGIKSVVCVCACVNVTTTIESDQAMEKTTVKQLMLNQFAISFNYYK